VDNGSVSQIGGGAMSTFMVSYDLSQPNRDYEKVAKYLKSFGTYAKVLESLWYVESDLSAYEIAMGLCEQMDSDDHFIVSPIGGPSAWYNLGDRVSDWLNNRDAA
jgi:hypothetical protein